MFLQGISSDKGPGQAAQGCSCVLQNNVTLKKLNYNEVTLEFYFSKNNNINFSSLFSQYKIKFSRRNKTFNFGYLQTV
jgi:hypothetical protein